jgi:rhodanese-related sulfurtransferase
VRTRTLLPVALVLGLALVLAGSGCSEEASSGTTSNPVVAVPGTSDPQTTTTLSGYVTLSVNETFERSSIMNSEVQIVDVREPNEWVETGVPLDAVLIPLGELKDRAPLELAKDLPVYVLCNSGNRSQTGAQILIDLGYPEVYNVAGGIQAWLAAALPVESYR